jgi:hypothetical protein
MDFTTLSVNKFVAVDLVFTLQNPHHDEIVKIFVHNSSILDTMLCWLQFHIAVNIITDETQIIIQSMLKLDLSLLDLIDSKELTMFSNIDIIFMKLIIILVYYKSIFY